MEPLTTLPRSASQKLIIPKRHSTGQIQSATTARKIHSIPSLNFKSIPESSEVNEDENVVHCGTPRHQKVIRVEKYSHDLIDKDIKSNKPNWEIFNKLIDSETLIRINAHLTSENCTFSSLKLIGCSFTAENMENLLTTLQRSKTINLFHIENATFQYDICSAFVKSLLSIPPYLKTLQFVNVQFPVDGFDAIVDGIITQKNATNGITSLCFESCALNEQYADSLQKLCGEKTKLLVLNLESNYIGSNKLPTLTKDENTNLKAQKKAKLEKELKSQTAEEDEIKSKYQMAHHSTSKAVLGIAAGLQNNQLIKDLNLASNGINIADYDLLDKSTEHRGDSLTINLYGNSIEDQKHSSRLPTKGTSPRSVACDQKTNECAKILTSPRNYNSPNPKRRTIGPIETTQK